MSNDLSEAEKAEMRLRAKNAAELDAVRDQYIASMVGLILSQMNDKGWFIHPITRYTVGNASDSSRTMEISETAEHRIEGNDSTSGGTFNIVTTITIDCQAYRRD